jgi:acyl carrier protein
LAENYEALIRNFIVEKFLFEDDGTLSNEDSFLDNGVIDSTGVLELVAFLEETFSFRMEDDEVVPENLDSIRNAASFVERKLSVQAPRCAAAN